MDTLGNADPQHHVPAKSTYFVIFFLLLIFTALTVSATLVDLGSWNAPIAMTIAIAKTVLVVLYFMHLRHSTRLTWVVVAAAVLWLAVLFALTIADFATRKWLVYGDVN